MREEVIEGGAVEVKEVNEKEEEEEEEEEEEPREVAVKYYVCARPECRFRTEDREEAERHEHARKGHYCEIQYILKSRIRLY